MYIYSLDDRIKVEIEGLVFELAPLSYRQKTQIQSIMGKDGLEAAYLCVKYCLKNIEGVKKIDGSDYKMQFENNVLTEGCLDEILNIQDSMKLQLTCINFINGVPSKIVNPTDNQEIEGVKIINPFEKAKKRETKKVV